MSDLTLESLTSIPDLRRTSLEGDLRRINSKKIECEFDRERCLRESYDAIAQALVDCGEPLSEDTLTSRIPVLVFEIALEFGWLAREEAERDSFYWSGPFDYRNPPPIPEPGAILGSYKVQEAFKGWLLAKLGGRIEHWRGFALKLDVQQPTPMPAAIASGISPNGAEEPAKAESDLNQQKKKRGRPTKIADELKVEALGVKGGKARAQILYQTSYPTPQQAKNVPTILRHFERTHRKAE